MTMIVGIIGEEEVFIGADSLASEEASMTSSIDRSPKIFKLGEFLIGFSGAYRIEQVMRYEFTLPEIHEEDSIEQTIYNFIEALRVACVEVDALKTDTPSVMDSCFLIGYKKRLFFIDQHFQFTENKKGYDCIGSAMGIGLGCLFALESNNDLTEVEKIMITLEAGEYCGQGIRRPFIIKDSAGGEYGSES